MLQAGIMSPVATMHSIEQQIKLYKYYYLSMNRTVLSL